MPAADCRCFTNIDSKERKDEFKKIAEEIFSLLGKIFCRFRKVAEYYIGKFSILQVLAQLYFPFHPILFCVLLTFPSWLMNKSTTIFHGLSLIEHRNDVKMFKTRVKPLACSSWYTAYTAKFWHFDVIFMVNRIYRPWKIVDLLFTLLDIDSFDIHFCWSFLENCARKKEKNKITSPSLHFYGVYSYWVWSKRKGNNACRINVYQLVAVKNHFVACV